MRKRDCALLKYLQTDYATATYRIRYQGLLDQNSQITRRRGGVMDVNATISVAPFLFVVKCQHKQ